MAKVKLIKARSYSGIIVATVKKPIVDVSEDEAKALVATGYFEPYATADKPESSEDDGDESIPDYEALSEKTKAELVAYAEENGIDIEGCKTKADILEAISAANGGSYTMMKLQKEV